jgi:hypothetical protein
MPQTTRLDVETRVLKQYFPKFRIQDPHSPNGGVIGRMRTNSGNEYAVWLLLKDFPNEAPAMYIVSPDPLLAYHGRPLSTLGINREMHLLQPDSHGHPQVCHYNDRFWVPKVSLYKILMKARLWLHAYEEHMKRGEPIDKYLSHMQ